MNANLRDAVVSERWDTVRSFLLEANRSNRRAIGLDDNSTELSAMQLASLYDPELTELLVNREISIDIHSAAAMGNIDLLKRFATQTNLSDEREWLTPMGFALVKNDLASVRTLLQLGEDPNRPMRRIGFFEWEVRVISFAKWYPIHAAATHGYHENAAEIVSALIDAGANVHRRCPMGCAAIHLASIYGWLAVVELLLAHGNPVDERTTPMDHRIWLESAPNQEIQSQSQTSLMIAAQEGGLATARLLISAGANVNARDALGNTPLHCAAAPWWQENVEVIETLLEGGADIATKNYQGLTPLDLAELRGNQESFKVLSD